MKKIVLLVLVLTTSLIYSQDVIVKKNGDEVNSKIIEITANQIKYKEFEFQEGPTRNINISDIFMIIYENGKREKFTEFEKISQEGEQVNDNVIIGNNYESGFILGVGYGNSYGGSGILLEWRGSGKNAFAVHAGVGYFPDAPVLASGGVKYFINNLYVNAQFGLVGYEYESSSYYDYYDDRLLYGPSLLVGGEWLWGKGFGLNIGGGGTYVLNSDIGTDFMYAIDLGFIMKF